MSPWNLVVLFGAFLFAQAGFSQAPNITKQPDSANAGRGSTVTFTASLTGMGPLKMQWSQNGAPVPDATNINLVISNVQPAHAGTYSLLVTNTLGQQQSSNAMLVVGPVTIWGSSIAGNIPLSLTNAVAIGAGENHLVALKSDAQATAWSKLLSAVTNIPPDASNVVGVAALRAGSGFLRSDGTVVDSSGKSTPSFATNIVEIAAGNSHYVGLRRDGTVVAWSSGFNSATNFPTWLNDAVGVSASTTYSLAVRGNGKVQYWGSAPGVSNLLDSASDVISAAAGTDHCLLLKADGTVVAAGANEYGQTNVPAGLSGVVGVAAGAQVSYAIRSDGTLVAWGRNTSGQTNVPPGLGTVAAVTTRFNQTAALTSDGNPSLQVQPFGLRTVSGESYVLRARASGAGSLSYQWYFNGTAIEGANSADLVVDNAKSEASGSYYVVVTNSLGAITSRVALVQVRPWSSLEMWGRAGGLNSNPPSELSEFKQVSAGLTHCIALTMDGKAICWGDASQGQCDVPANATNLIYVMAGMNFSGAIRNDGRLLIWGSTNAPLVNPDMDQLRVIAPMSEPLYGWAALKTDGTVYVRGNFFGRQVLPGFTNIQTIASGELHLVGLRSNGTVAVWSQPDRSFLTPPQNLTNVVGVAAGDYFSLALKADGSVVAWGHPDTVAPVPTDLTNAVWIAAAARWCMAGTSDGRLISWSGTPVDPETFGPLNVPDRWDGISSVSVQRQYALALSTNRAAHITQTPRSRSTPLGFPAEFKAWASGQPPINYQ